MKLKLKVLGTIAGLGLLLFVTVASALGPAEEGRRVYLRENCYACHGGRGGGGMGPQFRREPPERGNVADVAREGAGEGMPAYPHLTAQEISNLSAYFRTLRTSAEPTFTHWWEAVPSK